MVSYHRRSIETLDIVFEVHAFVGEADVAADNPHYPPGERRRFIALLRQDRQTEHDLAAAQSGIEDAGWTRVIFARAGWVPDVEVLNSMPSYMKNAYEKALVEGLCMVVYDGDVGPAV